MAPISEIVSMESLKKTAKCSVFKQLVQLVLTIVLLIILMLINQNVAVIKNGHDGEKGTKPINCTKLFSNNDLISFQKCQYENGKYDINLSLSGTRVLSVKGEKLEALQRWIHSCYQGSVDCLLTVTDDENCPLCSKHGNPNLAMCFDRRLQFDHFTVADQILSPSDSYAVLSVLFENTLYT